MATLMIQEFDMTEKKSWKNENVNFEIQDIVRYNSGYLCILKYSAGSGEYQTVPFAEYFKMHK